MFKEEWLQYAPTDTLIDALKEINRAVDKTEDFVLLDFYADGIDEINNELANRLSRGNER